MPWAVMAVLAGWLLGLGVAGGIFWFTIKKGLVSKKLPDMDEGMILLRKLTPKTFIETQFRAETGQPVSRPYGSKRGVFSWEKILFNPSYLTKVPLAQEIPVQTEVVLGSNAAKPLKLQIPIVIGGMAYGSAYSAPAKMALAKAATLAGTAANSGNGPFLEAERQLAGKFILQYTRGFWSRSTAVLQQADMIEIALGHSARASSPVRIQGQKVVSEVAQRYGSLPGLDVLMEARLPEVESQKDWIDLIRNLKEITGGVPIAVKFGASHYLEQEIELFIRGGVDVLVFDGLEGGTHGGKPLIMDDMGLPVLPALCRARRYLCQQALQDKVSLVIGGGLVNPGDFAKCLALGADAVLIGTVTAVTQMHTQVGKAIPYEPPTVLLYNEGQKKDSYDSDKGAQGLAGFLLSCTRELEELARCLGKRSLSDFQPADLIALDPLIAEIAGIAYGNSPLINKS